MLRPPPLQSAVLAASLTILVTVSSSCGSGTASALSGGGGSGTNAPPAIAAFRVVDPATGGPPRTSPAEIRFVLSDAEGSPAQVEFLYRAPGFAAEHIAHLTSLPGNPVSLPTSAEGTEYALAWDFAAEDLLPDDASFTAGVLVYARVLGTNVILAGANSAQLGLGNDAPVVQAETPPVEVYGVVPVRLHLSDSSSDPLDVRIEYDIQADAPDAGWQIARPAGLLPVTPTPPLALEDITVGPVGTDVAFFWDTDVDLRDLERDVNLRVTPIDPAATGAAAVTGIFRIDNNAAPIVQLHEGAFLANPDSVLGIPVPFTVIDEESDPITLVFQWRREGEFFPELPGTTAAIHALLSDTRLWRQYHVCTQYPRTFEGRAIEVDATHLRLPELQTDLSFLAQMGLDGRELGIARPSHHLLPLSGVWPTEPFVRPVAALPLHSGAHALILDQVAQSTWRLVEVRLQDGALVGGGVLGGGTGRATALCFDRNEVSVLVASSNDAVWRIDRIDPSTGAHTFLADATSGAVEQGEIRGIASIGTNAAVVTVGSSLVQVNWTVTGSPHAVALRTDLALPWGVVADPLDAGWLLVAENAGAGTPGPGRIVAVHASTHTLSPVAILPSPTDGQAFPRPRGIAVTREGVRLLALCEGRDGTLSLRGVERGRGDLARAYVLGPPIDASASALNAGAGDALLTTSPVERRVFAAGGLTSRSTVRAVDPGTGVVELGAALSDPLPALARWRIVTRANETAHVPSSPQGSAGTFTWDSRDVHKGAVYLRAVPLDAEIGTASATTGAKSTAPPFSSQPLLLAGTADPVDLISADLDGDGDLELVAVNSQTDTLTIHWQVGPGAFTAIPTVLGGPGITGGPNMVHAADLDGDGDLDLVSANSQAGALTLFWQVALGVFDPKPTHVGQGALASAISVQAVDMDSDQDLDLLVGGGGDVLIFRQIEPGSFEELPWIVQGSGPSYFARAADLDGDGDLDVAATRSGFSGQVVVSWQTSGGVFGPQPTVLGSSNSSTRVAIADLDGDGQLDLVSSNYISDDITIFWQSSPGVFQSTPTRLVGNGNLRGPWSVQPADLDVDGDLDLVSSNGYSGTLTVCWQGGPRQFDTGPSSLATYAPFDGPTGVDAADFDGDGDLDVAAAIGSGGALHVYWQTTRLSFEASPSSLSIGPSPQYPYGVCTADSDRDGDLDLVTMCFSPGQLVSLQQAAPGQFAPPLGVTLASPSLLFSSLEAADLDQDGDQDLVTARSHDIVLYAQSTPGDFSSTPTILNAPQVQWAGGTTAADIDHDGGIDLIRGARTPRALVIYWQADNHTFDSTPSIVGESALTGAPGQIVTADMDGDGDSDLVSSNRWQTLDGPSGVSVSILWQVAPREFSPEVLVLLDDAYITSFAIEDIDGDGDNDIVSAHSYDPAFLGNLRIWWQTSPGTFAAVPDHVGGPNLWFYAGRVGDVDSDGDKDLIAIDSLTRSVVIFRQTAPSTFEIAPIRPGGGPLSNAAGSLRLADLDANGDLDVILVDGIRRTCSVYWSGRR